jgi:hypothetical protein
MKTDDKTLVCALRILATDIQSDDGVANACIEEAANRIEELLVIKGYYDEVSSYILKSGIS